jgi:hypothetical protein
VISVAKDDLIALDSPVGSLLVATESAGIVAAKTISGQHALGG